MLFAASIALLLVAWPFVGTGAAVWCLVAAQGLLLADQIKTRQVSGVGAFMFLYFLFMSVRAIYLYVESDYATLVAQFAIRPDLHVITSAMWWATCALLCFAFGARAAFGFHRSWLLRRRARADRQPAKQRYVAPIVTIPLLMFQLVAVVIMFFLASMRRGIYGTESGAYLYDVPMLLQAVHIISLVCIYGLFLQRKTLDSALALAISCLFLLIMTWLMREVSIFRGYYITGLMICGIAVLQQAKQRVSYWWLIVPVVALQPLFGYLGAERRLSNEELLEQDVAEEIYADESLADAYWNFYSSKGDMNIFDTFVGATKTSPRFYPYTWSWIYVPLHFIPRALWPGKPKRGITQDISFTRGAPLSPGIVGFFLLDGGFVWMLASMFVLGYLLATLDGFVLTMPAGYLRSSLVGIVVVMAMFFSRLLLWQYFYQTLYMIVVVVIISLFVRKISVGSITKQRRSTRSVPRGEPAVAPSHARSWVCGSPHITSRACSAAKLKWSDGAR
jgi:hypothetical protein